MRVVWTQRAKTDLRNLFDHYQAGASKTVARRIANHIVERSAILAQYPLLGPIEVSLAGKSVVYRSLVIGNQKIIYWIDGSQILIATLFDCRQDPGKLQQKVD